MYTRKWIMVVLSGGLLLQLGACASDFGYYLLDAFLAYLPQLLDAWLAAATQTA